MTTAKAATARSAHPSAARDAGERFYPAFHFLVWGGKGVEEAVAAAMFETAGEA